jgi:hypothetical protein
LLLPLLNREATKTFDRVEQVSNTRYAIEYEHANHYTTDAVML